MAQKTKIPNIILFLFTFCIAIGTFACLFIKDTLAAPNDSANTGLRPFGANMQLPTVKDQYLNVKGALGATSPSNQIGTTKTGSPNFDIRCGTNEQLLGIAENIGNLYDTTYMQANYDAMPRAMQDLGNFRYIPRCNDMDWFTLECRTRDWITQYNTQDYLMLRCAPTSVNWETKGSNPNPGGVTLENT